MLLALLLPDPCDVACPSSFKQKARTILSSGLNVIGPTDTDLRKALQKYIAEFADWNKATDEAHISAARLLVHAAYEESPLVVDPFAGGGAIPLEALRLGCETFASDLNPVACLILKTVLEDVPKFQGNLALALKRFGDEVTKNSKKDLATLYPSEPNGAKPIAYLWARTVRCEAPDCGAEIPLTQSFWLSKKKDRLRALRIKGAPAIGTTPQFEIFEPENEDQVPKKTVKRAKATCMACGTSLSPDRVRAQLSAQRGGAEVFFDKTGRRIGGARLLAVVTLKEGEVGRHYRLPTNRDYEAVRNAQLAVMRLASKYLADGLSELPNESLPAAEASRYCSSALYGMSTWVDLFSCRQKLALSSFLKNIRTLGTDQPPAVVDLTALAIGKTADLGNSGAPWQPGPECPVHLFSGQKIPPLWDWAEATPVEDTSGSFVSAYERSVTTIERAFNFHYQPGTTLLADAKATGLPSESADVFFTDPPYYDAVPYADLADFFFVWLKRALPGHALLRDPFDRTNPLTPKLQEAVEDESKTVNGRPKDRAFFENAMADAFLEGRRLLKSNGIGCVVFAHKTTEGWEALLSGMIKSGWVITASWPIATERGARLRARESAALATSVHLVCRPRMPNAPIGDWIKISQELPLRVGAWMERLNHEGIRGADLVFACIGPAMELYSQYSEVLDSQDRKIPLGGDPTSNEAHRQGYLAKVWEVVGRIALQRVLGKQEQEGSTLEEDARLTALFLWALQSSFNDNSESNIDDEDNVEDSDEADEDDAGSKKGYTLVYDVVRRFAQPLGIRLENWEGRIIETRKGFVRLIPVTERESQLFDTKNAPSGTYARKKKEGKQTKLFDSA
jgi:adenine-specific DNA methylase